MSRPCVECKHGESRRTDGTALDAGEHRDASDGKRRQLTTLKV